MRRRGRDGTCGVLGAIGCLALAGTLACADGNGASAVAEARMATVDTLPGGAVRIRGPEGGAWAEGRGWRLVEELRLGGTGGEGAEAFGEAWTLDLATDPLGRTYVMDRTARAVRVFGRDGGLVRTLGGPGEGPGEFQAPWGLAWAPGGHLWVFDVRRGRHIAYDTAGALQDEYPRRVGGYSLPWDGGFGGDGWLFEVHRAAGNATDPLIAFRPEGGELVAVDTFPRALAFPEPAEPSFWDLTDERGIGAHVAIPYSPRVEWALGPNAEIWMGNGARYAIAKRDLRGDTTLVVEREVEPVPVSREERSRAIEGIAEEHRRHPKMDLSRIPDAKPAFRKMIPDPTGRLWVLREVAGGWAFDVFNTDGTFLGAVDIPVVPELVPPPVARENALLLVTTDELDVPTVVRYRIERGSP